MESKPFFSLKWKTLIVISLVFSLIFSAVTYIIFTEFTRIYEKQIAESIRKISSALLAQNRSHLIEIGTTISLTSRGADAQMSEKNLVEYLDNNWDLMEIEWGLESLSIYDLSTDSTIEWDMKQSLNVNTLLKTSITKGPSTTITCTDYCRIYAKIPMFFVRGDKKYLIIGTGLIDFRG